MDFLHTFFALNHSIIIFAYGLAFFVLGLAIALQSRRHSRLHLARSLPWLAAFGLAHGFFEWAGIMRAKGWTRAIVVSDGYHLFRAQMLFQQAGITPYPSPAQITGGPMHPVERFFRANRELAVITSYLAHRLCKRENCQIQSLNALPAHGLWIKKIHPTWTGVK